MPYRRHRRRRKWLRLSSNRTRKLAALGSIAAVLLVAVAIPLALSARPAPAPSNPAVASSLPYVPPLFPVGQSPVPGEPTPVLPGPGTTPGATNFPKPPPGSAGPGVVATRIRIPSLSIDLGVIEGDGVDVPMGLAAHYPGSSWSGGGSNIFLYAHARKGMFQNLWSARVGDDVFLDLIDGTSREYVVDEVRPAVAWNDLSQLDPTPTEQLTLMTCVGLSPLQPRFIVIAHPLA